jgi:hypothetical protein
MHELCCQIISSGNVILQSSPGRGALKPPRLVEQILVGDARAKQQQQERDFAPLTEELEEMLLY